MISPVQNAEARPLTYGGAVRLLWVDPTDVAYDHVVILRKATNSFTGITDPAAIVVYRGAGRQAQEFRSVFLPEDVATSDLYRTFLESTVADWNTTLYYAVYASNLAESDISVPVILPAALAPVGMFEELDVIGVLLRFINSYLNQQIISGGLVLPAAITNIQVFDGPPFLDNTQFPVVSLHLDNDQPVGFALGDNIGHMDDDGDEQVSRRGFMSNITIAVVGVSENPEIRRSLYRALKGCLIAARQLLEQQGLLNMEVSGRFNEDFVNYDMPLFSAELTLRGSIATSVMVPPLQGIIKTIDTTEGQLTPVTITG